MADERLREAEERLERPLTPEEREALRATFDAERGYRPVEPRSGFRDLLDRIWAPLLAVGGFLAKFGTAIFKLKLLFSAFISVGFYALAWGWQFGVGFVVLLFLHEVGHVAEAKRQRLPVHRMAFVPFLGAYVEHGRARDAYHGALIALAGPAFGGLASLACWGIGAQTDSDLFRALAYVGFFLNLINLLPFGLGFIRLDGAFVIDVVNPLILLVGILGLGVVAWRSHNWFLVFVLAFVAVFLFKQWQTRGQRAHDPYYHVEGWQPTTMSLLYGGLAALLVLGMVATHLPDPR